MDASAPPPPPTGFAELHVHLDGSIRAATFLELSTDQRFKTAADVEDALRFRPGWDLARCLECFSTTLTVLQTAEALERTAFELCEDLAADGVTYAEIRYCPSLHRQTGMADDAIVGAVAAGLRRATATLKGCRFYQIITALRDLGPKEALVMAKLAVRHAMAKVGASPPSSLVVGLDLAGNEHAHPPAKFVEAFDFAHAHGLSITVHAGEGPTAEAASNVVDAITLLHARRIGHGVAARHSAVALACIRDNGVAVEICPTSNVHTGSIKTVKDHPARQFLAERIVVCPCADNSLLSNTTTAKEYALICSACGVSAEDAEAVRLAAHRAGFASAQKSLQLLATAASSAVPACRVELAPPLARWVGRFWVPKQRRRHGDAFSFEALFDAIVVRPRDGGGGGDDDDEHWQKDIGSALKKVVAEDLGDMDATQLRTSIREAKTGLQDLTALEDTAQVVVFYDDREKKDACGTGQHCFLVGSKKKLAKKCSDLRNLLSHYHWRLSGEDVAFDAMVASR